MPVDVRASGANCGGELFVAFEIGPKADTVLLPERIHPYSSGFWGGLAGGGPWPRWRVCTASWPKAVFGFPINLLAGAVMPNLGTPRWNKIARI